MNSAVSFLTPTPHCRHFSAARRTRNETFFHLYHLWTHSLTSAGVRCFGSCNAQFFGCCYQLPHPSSMSHLGSTDPLLSRSAFPWSPNGLYGYGSSTAFARCPLRALISLKESTVKWHLGACVCAYYSPPSPLLCHAAFALYKRC